MTEPTLLDQGAVAETIRCHAPLPDGSTCSRPLRDVISRARGIGPDCWERLNGSAPRQYALVARRTADPDQPMLPIDVDPGPVVELAVVDPSAWPWQDAAGQVVCAQGSCTVVLVGERGPRTIRAVEAAVEGHAPTCRG